jgi:predicted DNA-binding protein
MATAETTTLRVPVELRDEIARLAEERGSTMLEVVTDAVHSLTRD